MKSCNKFSSSNLCCKKQDQAGALLLACTIEILLNKIIPINANELKILIEDFYYELEA